MTTSLAFLSTDERQRLQYSDKSMSKEEQSSCSWDKNRTKTVAGDKRQRYGEYLKEGDGPVVVLGRHLHLLGPMHPEEGEEEAEEGGDGHLGSCWRNERQG